MKKIVKFCAKHWFGISSILILLLSAVLRFYNYDNRFALAADQARDAIIGREALFLHRIPGLGPFSQAGTFVMGPIWYWLVALSSAFYPFSIITPWIAVTISFIGVVYVMMLAAKELGGKYLSIIVGIFTAVSVLEVGQSTNLTNPSGIAILSACSVYFAIRYIRTQKSTYIFLFPLFISLAINVHLQALGLLPLLIVPLVIKRPNFKQLLIAAVAFILPFTPLIYFDIRNKLYDTRSMLDFYLYGQYRIYVPNRWLTYVGSYWPNAWSSVVGGDKIFGYLAIILVIIVCVFSFWKRKITGQMLAIISSFLLSFVMLRYFRGERFDGYIIFLHPFILILTGWACLELFKFNRFVGILIIALFVLGSLRIDYSTINNSNNSMQRSVQYWEDLLIKRYPNKKFALYDLPDNQQWGFRLALGLFLDEKGKVSENGYKIGIGNPLPRDKMFHPKIISEKTGLDLWDLNSSSSAQLQSEGAKFVNPSAVYDDVEGWYKNKKL